MIDGVGEALQKTQAKNYSYSGPRTEGPSADRVYDGTKNG